MRHFSLHLRVNAFLVFQINSDFTVVNHLTWTVPNKLTERIRITELLVELVVHGFEVN
jgi:hypothetical protein